MYPAIAGEFKPLERYSKQEYLGKNGRDELKKRMMLDGSNKRGCMY